MSISLKTDDKSILSVLLYQFLSEKSAYSSFKEFNKVVKDNFISRDDFKFWFDRFSSGKLDEEEDDLSISDLKSVLSDDKHRLRACIFFETLKEKRSIEKSNDEKVTDAYNRLSKVIDIDFSEFSSCFNRFIGGNLKLKDCEFSDLPLEIVEQVVENLDYFGRSAFRKVSKNMRSIVDDAKFACFSHFNRFGRILKSLDDKLHVRHLFLSSDLVHPLENIIPFLKPEILETISVNSYFFCADLMKRLMGMDQWKNARNLEIYGILCNFGSTENVLHFENITLHVLTMVNNEELAQIKKILLESSQIETFCIDVSIRGKIDWNVIEGGLGPIIPGIDGIRRLVSRNKQQFYEIEEEEKSVKFVRKTYY
ncbi:hypothetical protein L5515_009387 [Caenorhabditis briggsae]|uniref:F-box domain-containing protein n=1 Tax=Caenorhabditis briggsae TaxID=6238 RepID=A0AAE9JM71_CAEBR|nr:hypothetical protein L5515_009387 [Caenorhabditis briggsae]